MRRYCQGDSDAFRALYAGIAPRLTAYLRRMCGDQATADDLVQQTFLKVHRSRASYVLDAAPAPWIFAIGHRTFLDEMRRRKRARVRVARKDGDLPEAAADIRGGPLDEVRPETDPELMQAALEALDHLPPAQREALVLTKLGGKSIAEAAAITGATAGAVKLRAHRGYVALRKALAERGQP